ncbi:hypothetical protein [Granulicella sp. dw_53]|uniref:hypothetical protein n=1 Tax=Granulicella sp. dw_53 TaxID=2719792 RepID=UPI001BD3DC1A|nr:hypothetical protein [Granulicella sp. dw_53]
MGNCSVGPKRVGDPLELAGMSSDEVSSAQEDLFADGLRKEKFLNSLVHNSNFSGVEKSITQDPDLGEAISTVIAETQGALVEGKS